MLEINTYHNLSFPHRRPLSSRRCSDSPGALVVVRRVATRLTVSQLRWPYMDHMHETNSTLKATQIYGCTAQHASCGLPLAACLRPVTWQADSRTRRSIARLTF